MQRFPSHNNYAQFIEVSLPIALWWALRDGWRSWGYALIGGALYASVIGAASRAGAILCTAELLAMLVDRVDFTHGAESRPGSFAPPRQLWSWCLFWQRSLHSWWAGSESGSAFKKSILIS